MKELMKRIWKKDEGFSLIELIIVIAILAIIAAIAVPNLIENINRSRRTADVANAKIIADSIAVAIANDETNSTNISWAVFRTAGGSGTTFDDARATLPNIPVQAFQTGTYGTDFEAMVSGTVIEVRTGGTTKRELFPTPEDPFDN